MRWVRMIVFILGLVFSSAVVFLGLAVGVGDPLAMAVMLVFLGLVVGLMLGMWLSTMTMTTKTSRKAYFDKAWVLGKDYHKAHLDRNCQYIAHRKDAVLRDYDVCLECLKR